MSGQPRSHLRHVASFVVCVLVDVGIVALVAAALFVIVSGGTVLTGGGFRLRLRTVENPVWVLTLLIPLRYLLRNSAPFLGRSRWPLSNLHVFGPALAEKWVTLFSHRMARNATVFLLVLCCGSFLLKAAFAWSLPGFFSGDDVEIHEMTLGVLTDHQWPVWDLRSAFFPMGFVYPAQRIAAALSASRPEVFVFAGRVSVALLSTLAIPLVWMAARRLYPRDAGVAPIAVLFFAVNKLQVSFGSSELPRPVSTVFVLAAFLILLRAGLGRAAIGGALLGIAAAFRFSEAVFVLPALFILVKERRLREAMTLTLAAISVLTVITAAADLLYWGAPLVSIRKAVEYTLIHRGSSRGYQPVYEYVRILPAWSTIPVVLLAIIGSRPGQPHTVWLWIPLAVFSLLPHKESRYLIPLIPFLALNAAAGLLMVLQWVRSSTEPGEPKRCIAAILLPFLALSLIHDAGGWRLTRSNEGVRLAQHLRGRGPGGIAAESSWRMGGQPFLWEHTPVVDLDHERLASPESRAAAVRDARWVALRSRTARTVGHSELQALGFTVASDWRGEDYVLFVRSR